MSTHDHRLDEALGQLRDAPVVDRVEEANAHAEVQAALFERRLQPVALGRYVVLDRIGAGGSGTVYRAYDSDLHRQVAVKIVPEPPGDGPDEPERLMREARVLASVSHPNIVAVHDVGVVPRSAARALGSGGIYLVMELVEGRDLRDWCRAHPRSWRVVMPPLLAAARGLAQAHRSGIVHRDVKPHNVRVGDDGRTRVLDFGLAAALPAEGDPSTPSSAISGGSGTPPYMAPEQHAGDAADERTDQFGFCVMAWEILFGARPFVGTTTDDLVRAKQSGPPGVPDDHVPGWIVATLRRGLDPRPDRRFASMGELIAALDRPTGRRRRTILAGLAGGTVIMAVLLGSSSSDPLCDDIGARLDGVWDPDLRARMGDAFSGAGVPYGEDALTSAAARLDAWTTQWTSEYEAVCADPGAPEVLAERTLCLGRQLDQVGRTAHLLADADETVVRHTAAVIEGLPDPGDCRRESPNTNPDLDTDDLDPDRRAKLMALDADMQRAELLRRAGKVKDAGIAAQDVEVAAGALDAWRALTRARLLQCRVGQLGDRAHETEETCYAALESAERSGSVRLAIHALLRLAEIVGQPDDRERADALFRTAWARLQAAPEEVRTPRLMGWFLGARGKYEQARGNHDEALALLQQSLEVLGPDVEPDSPVRLPSLLALAGATSSVGRMSEAHEHHRQALRIASTTYGELHPRTGMVTNNYGNFLLAIGRYEESAQMLERALHIKRTVLGDDSALLATTELVLARVHNRMGNWQTALTHADRSIELHDRNYPNADERRALAVAVRGQALHGLDRCEEILTELELLERRALATDDRPRFDPSDISIALGHCLEASGRPDAARAAFERALAAQEAFWGPGDRHLVETLVALGTREHLDRALTIVGSTEGNPKHADLVAEASARLQR